MASLRTVIVVLLGFLHVGEGGNILIFSGYGEGSHFMTAALVGKELMHRGNNVTVLISNAYEHRVNETKYKDLNFEIFKHIVPPEEVRMRLERFTESIFKGTWLTDVMSNLTVLTGEMADDCHALFNDEALLQRLLQAKFDVAFVDPIWPCSLLVAEYAAKRHVSFMATAWMNDIARVNGNPSNTAFVPEMNTGFTNKMTFIQRIINSIVVMLSMWLNVFTDGYTQIQHAHGICPDLQPSELYKRSQLLLVNVDFALEFSIPIMPHLIPVGGLSSGPANSLNQDLEEYVQSSGDAGIIVFSLGTYVTYMKEELIAVFANAFAKLPQKVIWQFRGTPPAILDKIPNIKTMEWLPQNDLLGHNKTRAFMYQGGNNGLYEALYHAVPVVVIPLIGDQPDVAARVMTRGMGLSLDIMTITTEKIVDTLNAVIHEKHYKETVKRMSAIFHDRPMRPVEKAAFWIEHVIKHGGEYMRSPIHDLTWYQYYLLDVVAFLLLVLVVVIVFIVYSCKFAFRCCKRVLVGKKAKTD
ncbi:UDP-glucuronosyltransferase 2C1 isoform X3 [Strongylocentrotus purpuratus]|uniref:Glucuronosyltransferase n=1 Tax=Strongylocentrotus purpuratus TaxID=7668 RepID=A0A7M7T3Z6_STRPU|nr:UDP-glucuronosyltransferase 2C1 isoform X3 [Strongylocentrotus purpuratus]